MSLEEGWEVGRRGWEKEVLGGLWGDWVKGWGGSGSSMP